MSKKTKEPRLDSWTVYEHADLKHNEDGDGLEVEGHVTTRHGFVLVYQDGPVENKYPLRCQLQIIKDGREYTLEYEGKFYSDRYLVTLAKRFAERVFEGDE